MAKWGESSMASPMAVPVKDSELAEAIAGIDDVNLMMDTVLSEEEVEHMEAVLAKTSNLLKRIRSNG